MLVASWRLVNVERNARKKYGAEKNKREGKGSFLRGVISRRF